MAGAVLTCALNARDPEYLARRAAMEQLLAELGRLRKEAAEGGGAAAQERHRSRGKLLVRERLALLLDDAAPFLELSALAGYETDYRLGGGMVTGIGIVAGTHCVIAANDPTDLGGALTAISVRKLLRALEVARVNRLPFIQFVESAGGDLRGVVPGEDPTATLRRQLEHFAESGGMFYDLSDLSARGIPTISVVFGSSTAGGAYQPGLSDYTIFVEGSAKVFLGGPPLVRMATGELATDEELGGARMHADVSGLADYLATSEADGIRMAREIVDHLEWRPRCDLRVEPDPAPPRYDPDELLGLIPVDLRGPVEIREVIARIVDDSRFEEFKARYGSTLVTGWAQIVGMPVGILANNGVLLADSAAKGAQFIQLCNQIGVPIVFLQHITGFMVGRDYERSGIIKQGSALIKAVSNSAVPHVTVILGASYGAGNYAMAGRAFGTRFVFAWPTARIAIMGPAQMAGVMSLVRAQQAARRGIPLDEDAEAAARTAVEALADAQSRVLYATGRVADDGIIDPRDTRWVLAMALSATRYAPIRGADSFGVFRL